MVSKKKLLNNCRLYLILDAGVCPYDRLFVVLKEAVCSGVDIVQLRDKVGSAKDILFFGRKALSWLKGRVPFIINDRIDIARVIGASGVHLGQDDVPLVEARRMLGPRAMIGISCQSLAHVRQACKQGADYAGFGSVYKTLTKPERSPMDLSGLGRVVQYAGSRAFPFFAIGGITRGNLDQVKNQGVCRVAVCRDILLAGDTRRSVGEFRAALIAKN